MTTVRYEEVSLQAMINRSSYILVAEKADPFLITREIPITPAKTKKNSAGYPPFWERTYHFKALEVMHSKDGSLSKGKTIKVFPSDYYTGLELHRRYFLEGLRKSTIEPSYKTGADLDEAEKLILFLAGNEEKGYIFCVHDAYEALSERKTVQQLLDNPPEGVPELW